LGLGDVPVAPDGVSLHQNVQSMEIIGMIHSSLTFYVPFAYQLSWLPDLGWWYNTVKNKGPWDYKQKKGCESGTSPYADFGNFNYGAAGSALGIPANILLRAAGWAQQNDNTSDPDWGGPFGNPPYGDDPRDQKMINDGISYYLQ
jgi:hypothetical protein